MEELYMSPPLFNALSNKNKLIFKKLNGFPKVMKLDTSKSEI